MSVTQGLKKSNKYLKSVKTEVNKLNRPCSQIVNTIEKIIELIPDLAHVSGFGKNTDQVLLVTPSQQFAKMASNTGEEGNV